jgi:hypothetical protein
LQLTITNNFSTRIDCRVGKNGKRISIGPDNTKTITHQNTERVYVYTHVSETQEVIGSNNENLEPNPGLAVNDEGYINQLVVVPRMTMGESTSHNYNYSYLENPETDSDFIIEFSVRNTLLTTEDVEKDLTIGHDGIPPL